jgi:CHASE3 domain sensor protein
MPDGGIISLLLIKAKEFALCLVLGIIVLIILLIIVLLTIYRYNRNGINRIKQ